MTNETNSPNNQDTSKLSSKDDIKSELSKVATNPKKNAIIIIACGLVFAYFAYNVFESSKEGQDNVKKPDIPLPTEIVKHDIQNIEPENIQVPALPDPPKLLAPSAPPPPPPPPIKEVAKAPELPPLPNLNAPPPPPPVEVPKSVQNIILHHESSDPDDPAVKRKAAKRTSTIMLVGGNNAKNPATDSTKVAKLPANVVKQDTSVDYTKYLVLSRGKILDAVIETAVNSDTSNGEVRAIISKDVYADQGNYILIPRGSEIFGSSTADLKSGRVDIKWLRINFDNGYYLEMSESTVDNLGRKGIQGRLDEKNQEKIMSTILSSTLNVAVASALDYLIPAQNTAAAISQQGLSNSMTIQNQLTTIMNDATITTAQKISAICAVPTNTSSSASSATTSSSSATPILQIYLSGGYTSLYSALQTQCTTAQAPTADETGANAALNALSAFVNTQAVGLIQSSNAAATAASKSSQASQQAFDDITSFGKKMLSNDQFKSVVTLDQGTKVKIYVKQDYLFPKEIVRTFHPVR